MVLRSILRQVLLWLVTVVVFLSLLFLPLTATYQTGAGGQFESASQTYSLHAHVQEFKDFFQYIKENNLFGNERSKKRNFRPLLSYVLVKR